MVRKILLSGVIALFASVNVAPSAGLISCTGGAVYYWPKRGNDANNGSYDNPVLTSQRAEEILGYGRVYVFSDDHIAYLVKCVKSYY